MNGQQQTKNQTQPGFIATLDWKQWQHAKALRVNGIQEGAWSNGEEMFQRARPPVLRFGNRGLLVSD